MTQAQLADRAGTSQGTIGNAESGVRGRPRALLSIADALQVHIHWLEANEGPWDKLTHNVEPARAFGSAGGVPLISWVQAGQWSQIVDNFQPGEAEQWLPCPVRHGPRTYALTVRGVSMWDPTSAVSFQDGDIIFVDPDREALHRSLVVVRLDDHQEATFKQLHIEGSERMLVALNPSWPERIMRIDGRATLCGVCIGKMQTFI